MLNLIKFYPNFAQIGLNFAQICLEKIARRCDRIPCISSSYPTICDRFKTMLYLSWSQFLLISVLDCYEKTEWKINYLDDSIHGHHTSNGLTTFSIRVVFYFVTKI